MPFGLTINFYFWLVIYSLYLKVVADSAEVQVEHLYLELLAKAVNDEGTVDYNYQRPNDCEVDGNNYIHEIEKCMYRGSEAVYMSRPFENFDMRKVTMELFNITRKNLCTEIGPYSLCSREISCSRPKASIMSSNVLQALFVVHFKCEGYSLSEVDLMGDCANKVELPPEMYNTNGPCRKEYVYYIFDQFNQHCKFLTRPQVISICELFTLHFRFYCLSFHCNDVAMKRWNGTESGFRSQISTHIVNKIQMHVKEMNNKYEGQFSFTYTVPDKV
ncbi:unnamed protein product [Bursaphelenchus okinawaensis]|uniref:Uncharacterized protein n=1 Tax=Bursaphelenchus okinawaensis TaxID=465554 RepID=A0A811LJS1_9BILA|nr:unnamed protein product [Bursaphelenchus okinawaensis]CAG9123236.1 unnamed protein product [Bursaphelenchus okinawaensis]